MSLSNAVGKSVDTTLHGDSWHHSSSRRRTQSSWQCCSTHRLYQKFGFPSFSKKPHKTRKVSQNGALASASCEGPSSQDRRVASGGPAPSSFAAADPAGLTFPAVCVSPDPSLSLPTFGLVRLCGFSPSGVCVVGSRCGFNLCFLMTNVLLNCSCDQWPFVPPPLGSVIVPDVALSPEFSSFFPPAQNQLLTPLPGHQP